MVRLVPNKMAPPPTTGTTTPRTIRARPNNATLTRLSGRDPVVTGRDNLRVPGSQQQFSVGRGGASEAAIIETLSTRKLVSILAGLLAAQVLFVLVGALYVPGPSSTMEFLMTRCRDRSAGRSGQWFHIRPNNCEQIGRLGDYSPSSADVRDIVFVAQMPHVRHGVRLEYSPWFQFLAGYLDVEIEHSPDYSIDEHSLLELEVRMGHQGRDEPGDRWTEFIPATVVQRTLHCRVHQHQSQEEGEERQLHGNNNQLPGNFNNHNYYGCSTIDLFELGGSPHTFYLLNIRIPVNATRCKMDLKGPNCALGLISELRLIVAHQNGGFTFIWLILKLAVWPAVVAATVWYWRRVRSLNRPRMLVENAILTLGAALIILDLPIECVPILIGRPLAAVLVLSDIRQGIFYAVLFSFWLIFAGEHCLDNDGISGSSSGRPKSSLWNYWRNLSLVLTASGALLAYELGQRGMQLANPFYSIWSPTGGAPRLATGAIVVALSASLVYFAFLVYRVWLVWSTIRRKRQARLYSLMSEQRRHKVNAIIYRFKFLMLMTLVCAGATILSYYAQQFDEGMPAIAGNDIDDALDDRDADITGPMDGHASAGSGAPSPGQHINGDANTTTGPLSSDVGRWAWPARRWSLSLSPSAFLTGTFGMWNLYVMLLLAMYAPSHKYYKTAQLLVNEEEEEDEDGFEDEEQKGGNGRVEASAGDMTTDGTGKNRVPKKSISKMTSPRSGQKNWAAADEPGESIMMATFFKQATE